MKTQSIWKKILLFMLVAMLAVGLTACADKTDDKTDPTDPTDPTDTIDSTDLLPEEIEVDFEVEGQIETVVLKKYATENWYIYYDTSRLEVQEADENGVVKFTSVFNTDDADTEIWMSVQYLPDTDGQAEIGQLADETGATAAETMIGTLGATHLHAVAGTDADSEIKDYYFIGDGTGCYLVTLRYYLEAAEGFGSRMNTMLQTFGLK